MSENEKLRRQQYKRNRKKWILIQSIALVVALIIALSFYIVYDRLSRTYYIKYTEGGAVNYKVNLKENNFFEEDYVDQGHSYISKLIKNITADFSYDIDIDTAAVNFDYTYRVDAQVIIANKDSKDHLLAPTYEIVPETKGIIENGNRLSIDKSVTIDYAKHNAFVTSFINAYDLTSVSGTLVVTMQVDVISRCAEFEGSHLSSYSVSLNIPLVEENFSIFASSSAPATETKELACGGRVNQDLFRALFIIASVLSGILLAILVVYVYATRNEDINYANKVRKLLSAYRSFIQQIDGEFNVTGYQVVPIKTFNEMLGIRDTIQSPILMFENSDQTKTQFVISTNTKILYTFEIKVDNYDELYGEYKEEGAAE